MSCGWRTKTRPFEWKLVDAVGRLERVRPTFTSSDSVLRKALPPRGFFSALQNATGGIQRPPMAGKERRGIGSYHFFVYGSSCTRDATKSQKIERKTHLTQAAECVRIIIYVKSKDSCLSQLCSSRTVVNCMRGVYLKMCFKMSAPEIPTSEYTACISPLLSEYDATGRQCSI